MKSQSEKQSKSIVVKSNLKAGRHHKQTEIRRPAQLMLPSKLQHLFAV